MAVHVRWWSTLLSLLFIIQGSSSYGQLVPTDSILLDKKIISYSSDRSGNILLGIAGGSIIKYNKELDSLQSYNPTRVGDFTLLEAWHGFQVFAFNEKFQDFILLDRFLSRENRYSLGASGVFFVDLATISSDQNLWLLEENSLSLMKYDFRANEVILRVALDAWLDTADHNFTFIREYQNLLFLIDKQTGTYVFDNLGNFVKMLDTDSATHLTFSRENIYFLGIKGLTKHNLYTNENEVIDLPVSDHTGVLIVEENIYLIGETVVDMFEYRKN